MAEQRVSMGRLAHWYERAASGFEAGIQLLERRYTPLGRFRPGPFAGWGFLWQPALIGFVALCFVALGGTFTGSPFKLNMVGTWFFGEPTSTAALPPSQTQLLLAVVCTYGGLVLLMRVWLRLAEIVALHPGATPRSLWGIFVLWATPMVVAPVMFSRDVFSYAAQGEMTSHHLSPYLYGAFTLGAGPYVNPVDPLWGNAPAPYGPLFLFVDGWVARLARHNELATVAGLRLVELAALAAIGWGVRFLARSLRRDPSEAFVLSALNPMLLLELVNGAHNDAAMAAFLVVGVGLALRRRLVGAVLCVACAASIKAPAALALAFIGWHWWGAGVTWRTRVRPVAITGVLTAAVLGFWTWAAGFGFGWIQNLFSNATVRSWAAPATGIGLAAHAWLLSIGIRTSVSHDLQWSRGGGMLVALTCAAYLFFTAARRGWVPSLALALLIIVLGGPVVQPWYFAWSFVLLAACYRGRQHFWLLSLSMIGPFIGLPGGKILFAGLTQANPLLIAVAVAVLGGVLLIPMGSWTQWSWPQWRTAAVPSS